MNRFQEVRKKKWLRRINLAEALGISLTWVWIIEDSRGQGVITELKRKVAKTLDVDQKWLFPKEQGTKSPY